MYTVEFNWSALQPKSSGAVGELKLSRGTLVAAGAVLVAALGICLRVIVSASLPSAHPLLVPCMTPLVADNFIMYMQ